MPVSILEMSCRRSGRPILAGLDLCISDGEVVFLRGPNGAGKSTLLRALAGLLPATGRITLDGHPLGTEDYGERIAYAGHLDAIKPQLSMRENLAFWAALYGGGGVELALEAFDLCAIADRRAHACSAGQKRRLGLARLLLAPRRLWLLDEPTVSLDAAAISRFEDAVRVHCSGGGMALIATHVALGLAPARSLTLAPISHTAAAAAADPFLTGTWS